MVCIFSKEFSGDERGFYQEFGSNEMKVAGCKESIAQINHTFNQKIGIREVYIFKDRHMRKRKWLLYKRKDMGCSC